MTKRVLDTLLTFINNKRQLEREGILLLFSITYIEGWQIHVVDGSDKKL